MNVLTQLDAFNQVLADYHISKQGQEILKDLQLVLLAAPTSSGRNTIIHELLKTNDYHFVVSDTTRKPRTNNTIPEKNGVEYWFRSEEDMLDDLRNGQYLEAALIHNQQVSGVSIRELEKAKSSGKVAITDIEIVGVDSVLAQKPDTKVFFVVPPSFEEWHNRLDKRGHMSEPELRRRMASACEEFRHALEKDHYHYVINDRIVDAIEQIHQGVYGDRYDTSYQKHAQDLVEKLLVDTEKYIDQK